MAIFDAENIKIESTSNADQFSGWFFVFDSSGYEHICKPFSYTAGLVASYVYNWHQVPRIYPKGSYMINAAANIKRASDNTNIPAKSISIGLDWNSWCQSLDFELLGIDNLPLIKPTGSVPVEVIAEINGYQWHFYVERWNETYSFNSNSFSVSGRGIAAELDTPYSLVQDNYQTADISAHQLADTLLQSTGWITDWQALDWLIKGGAYSARETPIRAVLQIAKAQDCIAYADPAAKIIHILNRFKISSWNLTGSTPDAQIPAESTISISQEFNPQVKYNGVRLRGDSSGALEALIEITGTNGVPAVSQIINPLFTDTVVLQERGRIELCKNTGAYYKSTLAVPLFPAGGSVGLLNLGSILQYTLNGISYKGIVTAVRANADFSKQGIKTGQIVEVIRWP